MHIELPIGNNILYFLYAYIKSDIQSAEIELIKILY